MGVATFSQLKDYLKLDLGKREALESPTDWLGYFINNAYLTLCTRKHLFGMKEKLWFPQLETSEAKATTDGTAYIFIPATALIVRGIWDTTNDNMLDWIPNEEYWDRTGRADTNAEGIPGEYTRYEGKIYLCPTPNATINLRVYFKKRVAKLVSADAVTEIGEEWDEPIVKLATIQALMKLKEYDFAEIEKKHWIQDVSGLIEIYYEEARQLDSHIQPDMLYLNRRRT